MIDFDNLHDEKSNSIIGKVLKLLSRGYSVKEISEDLELSIHDVERVRTMCTNAIMIF